jgi:hypothetical protein
MIKNIFYVEDGSVDVDELIDELDETTKVIVYRQGSKPPILVQPETSINNYTDSVYARQEKRLDKVKTTLEEVFNLKMSKKLKKLLDELYTNIFC